MGTVIMHNVVSVDGFIADENDDVGPLLEWYFSGDTPITPTDDPGFDHSGVGQQFLVSHASADHVRGMWDSLGASVPTHRARCQTSLGAPRGFRGQPEYGTVGT